MENKLLLSYLKEIKHIILLLEFIWDLHPLLPKQEEIIHLIITEEDINQGQDLDLDQNPIEIVIEKIHIHVQNLDQESEVIHIIKEDNLKNSFL